MTDATPQEPASQEPRPKHHAECYACPVGSFFAEFQSAQPEAAEHLLNAAYELLEVARVAIDAAERAIDEQRARVAAHTAATAGAAGTAPNDGAPRRNSEARRARVRRIDIA